MVVFFFIVFLRDDSINICTVLSRGAAARSVTLKPTGCGFDAYLFLFILDMNAFINKISMCKYIVIFKQDLHQEILR